MNFKNTAGLVAVCALLAGALYWAFGVDHHHKYSADTCVAGADEKCPSQQYLDNLAIWENLREKLAEDDKKMQPVVDQWRGVAQRLNNQMTGEAGPGYDINVSTRKFYKLKPPPPTPPTAGSVPAPAPK